MNINNVIEVITSTGEVMDLYIYLAVGGLVLCFVMFVWTILSIYK